MSVNEESGTEEGAVSLNRSSAAGMVLCCPAEKHVMKAWRTGVCMQLEASQGCALYGTPCGRGRCKSPGSRSGSPLPSGRAAGTPQA